MHFFVFLAVASGAVDEAIFEEAFNSSPAFFVRMITLTYCNLRCENIYLYVKYPIWQKYRDYLIKSIES